MRSLFSARSFADRAATRRAGKEADVGDRHPAGAAGPAQAGNATSEGPAPVAPPPGGRGIFKTPGVRGPAGPAGASHPAPGGEARAEDNDGRTGHEGRTGRERGQPERTDHPERRLDTDVAAPDAAAEPAREPNTSATPLPETQGPEAGRGAGDDAQAAPDETNRTTGPPAEPRAGAGSGARAPRVAAARAGRGASQDPQHGPEARVSEGSGSIAAISLARPAALPAVAPAQPRPPRPIAAPARPPVSGASPRAPEGAQATGTLLTPQPPQDGLRLVPLQALAKGGRWRTEAMRSYRMPLLLWFTRGQGRITVAGFTRGYGAHNAVFVPARTMHGFEVTAQVFGTAVFFEESPKLPLPDRPAHLRVRDAVAQGEVTTILEQLGRETESDRPLRARAIHHHAGLLSVWLDRQIALADDGRPDTASLRLVRRFTEMVEAQLYTGQGVGDYAEGLGVTPTHLSRVCRETCGRSASEILADRVTFEARRLLAETTLPVKQVAQLLGYGSAAYFTRAFQNRTGQTPTQFRAAP